MGDNFHRNIHKMKNLCELSAELFDTMQLHYAKEFCRESADKSTTVINHAVDELL